MNSDKSDQQPDPAREVEPDHTVGGSTCGAADFAVSGSFQYQFVDVERYISEHGTVALIPVPVVGVVR